MLDAPPPPSSPSLRRRRQVILRRRRTAAGGAVAVVVSLVAVLAWPSGAGDRASVSVTNPTGTDLPAARDVAAPNAATPGSPAPPTPAHSPTSADGTREATPGAGVTRPAGADVDAGMFTAARSSLRTLPQEWPIVRGVYSTMWTFGGSRWNELMDLVRTTEVNAIVIDVKDDAGQLAWKDSRVTIAREAGSDTYSGLSRAEARARVQELRAAGGYPIARIVCFKDPIIAPERPDLAIHARGGGVWRDRKGAAWLDANLKENWAYLVDLGREAADMGFLEVQFDYVRFPTDGSTDATVYPRSRGVNTNAIRDFLAHARERLHAEGVRVSADIFGLTTYKALGSGDGDGTGQLFEDVISQVDYVSPMVYPSHYYPGNYGLSDPEAHPYEVVVNAMREAQLRVAGHRATVRPWLEDFSLTVPHHAGRVSAQLRATYENGIEGWLLWNAGNHYSVPALGPHATPKAAPPPVPPAPKDATPTSPPRPSPPNRPPAADENLTDEQLARRKVNELGRVLVMEWHEIKDEDGRWSNSLTTFKRQLRELYDRGYRPVTAQEFAAGSFPIAAGTTPVLLTFDDSYKEHFFFGADGNPHPDSVVGVLEEFARTHPGWRATASFAFYWPAPFREPGEVERKIRWLVDHGYELSNHSFSHDDLSQLGAAQVRRNLARSEIRLQEVVPGQHRLRTLTLPFGQWPADRASAIEGTWDGHTYRHDLVFLVGSMPTRSPHHAEYDATEVQRVQAYVPEFDKWIEWMDAEPGRRFVSDGNAQVVTYPETFADVAAPRPDLEVRTYKP